MSTFNYRCDSCRYVTCIDRPRKNRTDPARCISCGSLNTKRLKTSELNQASNSITGPIGISLQNSSGIVMRNVRVTGFSTGIQSINSSLDARGLQLDNNDIGLEVVE